jgi:hypothetical protein
VDPADLPAALALSEARLPGAEEWFVGDATPGLRIDNLVSGSNHGFANRFDPADFWDSQRIAPRPLLIKRIHFMVNTQGEPTGPMEWHIWEDNGGHKADPKRDIVPPFTVTGGPGQNVIDLDSLGISAQIDPPRMFHVGVANKVSNDTSPDILLDDGLPYVGDSGDFHASASGQAIRADPSRMFCGIQEWVLLALGVQNEPRSPVWMIWLEVEWLDPPERLYFDQVSGGDFVSAGRVAWADYDGDGYEDLLASGSKLYRNMGDGTFTDVTAAAGITDSGNGGLWADYDNDGDMDFYQYTANCVPCDPPQQDNYDDLWRNNGDGTFTNVRQRDYGGRPDAPVPRDPLPSEAAAWGDFNADGNLDLYVANHVDWNTGACFDDYLWLNQGPPEYAFRDLSAASGIRSVTRCGRGVNAADFDADGDLDIFVSNYRLNPNSLWVNQGSDPQGVPVFFNESRIRGVEGVEKADPFTGAYGHTIGSAWGDLDGDDDLDLVTANLAHSAWLCFSDPSMLYESGGRAANYRFADRRAQAGVAYVETHSDASLADFDNDGHLDLHITHVYDGWRSSLYRNLGRVPFSFEDVTHISGIYPRTGWGSAWADVDRDGDLDLAAQGLWANRAGQGGANWLQVKVTGCGLSNRDAVGARLGIVYGDGQSQVRHVVSGRGTGSQDSLAQHFGLGAVTTVDRLTVTFPSGQVRTMSSIAANRRVEATEVGAYVRSSEWRPRPGQVIQLSADTCGVERVLTWDLDGDGEFDDGSGPMTAVSFPNLGTHTVAVEVRAGGLTSMARATITVMPVQIYLPAARRQ